MSRHVVVGEVLGAFGVKGWVRILSYTEPPENILNYSPWFFGDGGECKAINMLEGRRHAGAIIAHLEGIDDRDQALALRFLRISVSRDQFPPPAPGEYYWADLVGLEVRDTSGISLGKVVDMIATGANDVMEVMGERERLIPFVMGEFVKEVRLDESLIIVDWDPDF